MVRRHHIFQLGLSVDPRNRRRAPDRALCGGFAVHVDRRNRRYSRGPIAWELDRRGVGGPRGRRDVGRSHARHRWLELHRNPPVAHAGCPDDRGGSSEPIERRLHLRPDTVFRSGRPARDHYAAAHSVGAQARCKVWACRGAHACSGGARRHRRHLCHRLCAGANLRDQTHHYRHWYRDVAASGAVPARRRQGDAGCPDCGVASRCGGLRAPGVRESLRSGKQLLLHPGGGSI